MGDKCDLYGSLVAPDHGMQSGNGQPISLRNKTHIRAVLVTLPVKSNSVRLLGFHIGQGVIRFA